MKFVVAVCVLIATIFLTRSSISPRVFGWKMRRYDMSNINRDQNQLVTSLEYGGVIRNQDVASVFRDVDRKFFVNGAENSLYAYMDSPLPIGSGQTISAPHMHAEALQLLRQVLLKNPSDGRGTARFLDVGSGSGYFSALMYKMSRKSSCPDARVYGIDCFETLVQSCRDNLRKLGIEGKVDFSVGDGWEGLSEHAPFDAIHVGAGAATVPSALLAQLAVGGRMVIPVGPQGGLQTLLQIDRIRASPAESVQSAVPIEKASEWGTGTFGETASVIRDGPTGERKGHSNRPAGPIFVPHRYSTAPEGVKELQDVDLSCFEITAKASVQFVPLIPNVNIDMGGAKSTTEEKDPVRSRKSSSGTGTGTGTGTGSSINKPHDSSTGLE